MSVIPAHHPSGEREASPTRFRWVVLSFVFISYMIAGADRANIGVIIPYIRQEFHLSNTDVGLMATLFYLGYAGIQIPAGLFFERFGVRKLFSLSLIATSLATLAMGFVGSAVQLKVARAVMGVAEGPLNVGSVSTINEWFPPRERGRAIGVFMASVKFAPAVVPPLCALVIYYAGWREVFYAFAVPGLLMSVLWFLFVSNRPADSRFVNDAERRHIESTELFAPLPDAKAAVATMRRPWLDRFVRRREVDLLETHVAVLRSVDLWLCALGYGFMVGIAYAIMTWIPTYLVDVRKLPVLQMGVVAAAPWVGAVAGNLLGGWLSDRFFDTQRKPAMLVSAFSTIGSMYVLVHAPASTTVLAGLFLGVGVLLNLGYSAFLIYPMGLVSRERVPFATAIVNTVGSIGGGIAPFVVGLILDRYDWNTVFMFLGVMSLVTLLLVSVMIEPASRKPSFVPA